jgi:hypothetical protein
MSVKITNFETWEVMHDDAPGGSHGGTLDPTTLTYGKNIDGTDNVHIVVVPCPFEGCGSVSYWPPGGGSDALLGQSLHVIMAYSQPVAQARGVEVMDVVDAAEDVKQRVIDTDGEERWVLDDAALEALRGLAGR